MAAAIESEKSNEIAGSRIYDAPRELVFRMWIDRDHVAQWWGPKGFRTTIHKMDVRPGGEWNFTMHGPDGRDYPNRIVYREIVEPERISYSHVNGPSFDATATFEELPDGKTRLTLRSVFATAELRQRVVDEFGAVEGMHQTLARLSDVASAVREDEFVIARAFDAPRDLVFRAWTEREHLAQWWGPKGYAMRETSLDLRPGGLFHYVMQMPNGEDMWGRFVFREIDPPRRLVYVNSFSNSRAEVVKPPFHDPWPAEMLTRIDFDARGDKTLVTLRCVPINATDVERQTFRNGHPSMNHGFGGTFDQLAAFVAGSRS